MDFPHRETYVKKCLALGLVAVFLIFCIAYSAQAAKINSCENGECVPALIDKLEELGTLYQNECLPKNVKDSQIREHHLKNGLTETCWRYITEINHLESELLKHQNRLEARLGCDGGECKLNNREESLNAQLANLSKVENNLSCTEPKKKQIKSTCKSDLSCVLIGSALNIGGFVAEKLLPASSKPKNCNLRNDNCLTQLATGFLRAAITFFDGAWDLLKLAGRKAKEEMSKFWNWVSGAEDHSSTSQLAMAKASEDKGIFDSLIKDFPGTMKKIWEAFMGGIKEWLKTKVFCQKWSGVPQFSQCLKPTESFDCIPCKTMVTGLCSATGTIVAEVVPAFLAGGLVTAVKYGANGAVRIARLFKVSKGGMSTVQKSKIGKYASTNTGKIDEALKLSKGLKTAKAAVEASLGAIKTYLLNPGRKIIKTSFNVMSSALRGSGGFVAQTPAGKVLVFSGNVVKKGLKVVLYPIDNPMTAFAYKSGVRSFEAAIKLGTPKLGSKTIVTSSIIQRNSQLETLLARLEKAKMEASYDLAKVVKLESDLISQLGTQRPEILKGALLSDEANLTEIIKNLYPELQYSDLARTLPKDKILAAETELYLEIQRMPMGASKTKMLEDFKSHLSSGQHRSRVVGPAKHPMDNEIKISAEKTQPQAQFNKTPTPEELAIKESITDYSEQVKRELLEEGAKTEQMIKTSKSPVVYDAVVIGAGPNNAVAISVLKEARPDLNVLVIEATEDFGTFNRIKGFDINTPEFIGNSGINLPGSPVQLRDFNITDASFASGEDLGNLTIGTYKSADPELIFNNTVIKWEKEPLTGTWPAKYRVETNKGLVVYTNSGLAGTGFGPPITRLKDPASVQLVAKYESQLAKVNLKDDILFSPKITSVDKFLSIATNDVKAGRSAMARYQDKKVLVVGSGDGGNIAVEATQGLNKLLNPKGTATSVKTVWLGQPSTNSQDFLASMGTRKNLRYARIAEGFDNGSISPHNGYLARVEEFTNEAGEVQFKAYYTKKDGTPVSEPLVVDNVIFATGYPNDHSTLTPIFSPMAKNANARSDEIVFQGVQGRVDDYTPYQEFKTDSEITKQLSVKGNLEDVYATGVFAKTPISDAEWSIPTGGFLDITAPKAAATGRLIAQKLIPQNINKKEMKFLLKAETGEKLDFIRRPVRPIRQKESLKTTQVADIHTKIEIGRSLRAFQSTPTTSFKVSIWEGASGTGNFVYQVTGLEKKAADKIVRALSENANLTRGIDNQFKLGRTRIDFEIPIRETGTLNLERMVFNPLRVEIVDPIVVPMFIGRGANKALSPYLRSAGSREEEKQAEKDK